MSNDPVRITFPDMSHMYTMGDSWSVRCLRLFDTEQEAQDAYNDDYVGVLDVNFEEQVIADKHDGVEVEIETKYGSIDRTYREMLTPICRASKTNKIITTGPAYPVIDYGYGN